MTSAVLLLDVRAPPGRPTGAGEEPASSAAHRPSGMRRCSAVCTQSRRSGSGRGATFWNVRPSPSHGRSHGLAGDRSTSLNQTWPRASGRKPEMTSNSVVLPAPLGPMRPTISPRSHVEADAVEHLQAAEAQRDVVDGKKARRRISSASPAAARRPTRSLAATRSKRRSRARPSTVAVALRSTVASSADAHATRSLGSNGRTSRARKLAEARSGSR